MNAATATPRGSWKFGSAARVAASLAALALIGNSPAECSSKGEWQLANRGAAAGYNYGYALSSAGDFDADGHTDLVVGIVFDSTLAPAAGRAAILFGGSDPGARPPLYLLGDAMADDHFGVSVAGGGDLDGDGYDDVAVGARFNDRGATDGGAVFVFRGGPGADGVADWVIPGRIRDDWFGQSIAIVPDIDGDGDDELLVGAPYNDDLGNAAGRAALYLGGPALSSTPSLIAYGDSQSNAHFGWSVSGAGDVDGDGYGDWIVGARLWGSGTDRARGRAYVFLGGPGADGAADRTYTGERKDDWFGSAVAGIGDIDGDGYDDTAVGAIFWDRIVGTQITSAVGRAYVFAGGATVRPDPIATLEGADADDQMGCSVAGPAGSPWSGRRAFVAGARFADAAWGASVGEVRVASLDASGRARTLLRSFGDAADDQWGHAVACIPGHLPGVEQAYAAAGVFNDEAGSGAGKVERAVRSCLTLRFPGRGEISWNSCGPFAAVGLLRGVASGGIASMACEFAGSASPFPSGPVPPSGDTFTYLLVGEDASGRDAAAGYDSAGSERRPVPSCP